MNVDLCNIRFVPHAKEASKDLLTLFAKVNTLVSDYMTQNPDESEKIIRRFVAGDVCREDLNSFQNNFVAVKERRGKITPWSKYVQQQVNQKKRKFSEMTEISKDFQELKTADPIQLEMWENDCEVENQNQEDEVKDEQIRPVLYKKAISSLKSLLNDMLKNFNTHAIVYLATDTVDTKSYMPFVHYSSGMS